MAKMSLFYRLPYYPFSFAFAFAFAVAFKELLSSKQ
jgi:hypothetical protein